MPFSTVFQLYHGSKCTYPCFPGVLSTLYSSDTHFDKTAFENIVGKGEIARNEQFLLFPQCLILIQIILFPFVDIYDTIALFAAEFEEPKIGISGKELTSTPHNILSNGCFHT